MGYLIGIDLGGTTAKFGRFSASGALESQTVMQTGKERSAEDLIAAMAAHVHAWLAADGILEEELMGIGIGVPGPVENASVVNHCVNLGWDVVPIVDLFQSHGFDCLIRAENDANVAALGEIWQGAAADKSSIVFVTVGTGVGGGIVVNHQILSGSHGAGGEIGHMPLLSAPLPFTCGCGGHYCLEQVASAPNIVRHAHEVLKESDEPSMLRHYNSALDARAIFDAARREDVLALKVVHDVTDAFGRGLAILGAVLDPDCFVIGGGVSHAGEALLQPLRESYQRYAFYVAAQTPIVQATLGNRAGIVGAARLVYQEPDLQ